MRAFSNTRVTNTAPGEKPCGCSAIGVSATWNGASAVMRFVRTVYRNRILPLSPAQNKRGREWETVDNTVSIKIGACAEPRFHTWIKIKRRARKANARSTRLYATDLSQRFAGEHRPRVALPVGFHPDRVWSRAVQ